MNVDGITIVSPLYGDRKLVDRMVFSVLHQLNRGDFKIHLVLVSDYVEKPREYNYYTSRAFKKFYNSDLIKITLIKNKEHKYQGESRYIGIEHGDYNWCYMIDCDDILQFNTCDTLVQQLRKSDENLACLTGEIAALDPDGNSSIIKSPVHWVQRLCVSRDFLHKYDIKFPTGITSKRGEDFYFYYTLRYAISNSEYKLEHLDSNFPIAFWCWNEGSISRIPKQDNILYDACTIQVMTDCVKYYNWFNFTFGAQGQFTAELLEYYCLVLRNFHRWKSSDRFVSEQAWRMLQNAYNELKVAERYSDDMLNYVLRTKCGIESGDLVLLDKSYKNELRGEIELNYEEIWG